MKKKRNQNQLKLGTKCLDCDSGQSLINSSFLFSLSGPLSGPSKVECVLPAAFSILAKRMMLSNPGCPSAFTRAIWNRTKDFFERLRLNVFYSKSVHIEVKISISRDMKLAITKSIEPLPQKTSSLHYALQTSVFNNYPAKSSWVTIRSLKSITYYWCYMIATLKLVQKSLTFCRADKFCFQMMR